jgi:HSP20 family protein
LAVKHVLFERRDPGREVRRFFEWLDEGTEVVVEHRPPMDVLETATELEVIVDLPGVPAEAIRVIFSRGTLVIAGRKMAPTCERRDTAFHMAERSFGRFACVVRVAGAVDAGRTRAVLKAGELCVLLSRIEERRGGEIAIAVERA